MTYHYAYDKDGENTAKAVGTSLDISTKHAIEICNMIRGMPLERAINVLEEVEQKDRAVPFRRFTGGVGHRTAIGPGRYPVKAAKAILQVVQNAKANAQFKGLGSNLMLQHILAQRASRTPRYGRRPGLRSKRTHIEAVVEEVKAAPSKEQKGQKGAAP